MDFKLQVNPIGKVKIDDNKHFIQIDEKYIEALEGIEGFSHLQIVWWGHLCDTPKNRANLTLEKLFKKGPDQLGSFATRSPIRPNPVMISTIRVKSIDYQKGIIITPYIDAEDKTPVIDIKPYYLMERVKNCKVPNWCSHWPHWYEDTVTFDWKDEINF